MNIMIRQERINRGWTLDYVAAQVGLSLTTIQKIETNQRKPSYDVLVKLENLFGLNHRQLFGAATPAIADQASVVNAAEDCRCGLQGNPGTRQNNRPRR